MRLVEIDDLSVDFLQHEGVVQAVRGISLHVDAGESLGIVGESGSGKSVTCLATLRLLRQPPARISADRDRKSTRLNSSHRNTSRMPSSA